MRLPNDVFAVSTARQFARRWATDEGLSPPIVADLELVVSELVTNALRHGLAPYDVDLRRVDGLIRGEVCDGLPAPPRPKEQPDETGGFGLGIVNACAAQWGTTPLPTGKQVWFDLKP